MKKCIKLASLASALLFSTSLWAVEFGGLLSNESKFSGPKFSDVTLDQIDTASAWLRIPFSKDGSSYFIAEGLYKFEVNPLMDDNIDSKDISAFDVDLFKVVTQKAAGDGTLALSLGRFATHDLSSMVFAQTADGALVTWDSTTLGLSAYGAYTGLLNGRTVSIISPDNNWTEDPEKKYQLAEKYAVGALGISFPNFAANQTLAFQVMDFYRLEGDEINRIYGEVQFNGPLSSNFYYILNGVFNYNSVKIGGESESTKGLLSRLALTWYPGAYNTAVTLNGVYASGKQGSFDSFCGFTKITAVNMNNGRTGYANLLKGGLTASVKPVSNLLVAASADAVFDTFEDVKYQGLYGNAVVQWQIVSDVQAGVSAFLFKGDDSNWDKAGLTASLAVAF